MTGHWNSFAAQSRRSALLLGEVVIVSRDITQAEAIWQAMNALGGERSIQEVRDWLDAHYPGRWKDVGTPMADLASPGNPSSQYSPERRFLERVADGVYRIRQNGSFIVGA